MSKINVIARRPEGRRGNLATIGIASPADGGVAMTKENDFWI